MDKTQNADRIKGRNDRLSGVSDKWYRYNRSDDGAAYDKGVVDAANSGKCPEHFRIIEVNF